MVIPAGQVRKERVEGNIAFAGSASLDTTIPRLAQNKVGIVIVPEDTVTYIGLAPIGMGNPDPISNHSDIRYRRRTT
jgi:hypothetical protein